MSAPQRVLSPQEQICRGCSGDVSLAYDTKPVRIAPNLWGHFPPKGYVHKPAKCTASHLWEAKYNDNIQRTD